jgi:RNA recognition motif-containing protein
LKEFGIFGKIVKLTLEDNRYHQFTFLEYATEESAIAAVRKMQGRRIPFDGFPLRIDFHSEVSPEIDLLLHVIHICFVILY